MPSGIRFRARFSFSGSSLPPGDPGTGFERVFEDRPLLFDPWLKEGDGRLPFRRRFLRPNADPQEPRQRPDFGPSFETFLREGNANFCLVSQRILDTFQTVKKGFGGR